MQNTAAQSCSTVFSAVEAPVTTPAVAAATVVPHDTVTASAQAVVNVRQHFEQLVAEREAWQDNAYRASNDQLYALLQKCYATYKAMSMDTAEAKALRSALTDYINLKGLKFNSGTHTIVKIVKCVFGADRRRVSAYGIVLRRALSESVSVLDIPTYIRDHGGVEEIRLARAPNAMTAKQKATVAAEAVKAETLGVFASAALGAKLDAGNIGKAVVLVGTWQADGSVIVRTVVQNDTAVNMALASYYSAHKDTVQKQAQQQQAANDEQVKQQAIAVASAAAVVNG
jgi:hypothetical protein